MKTAEQRAAKYAAKNVGDISKQRIDGKKKEMNAKYKLEAVDMKRAEDVARAVCTRYGERPMTHPFVTAFAREVIKLKKKFSGETLINEVWIIERKWEARGIRNIVCEAIKIALNIPLPVVAGPFRLDISLLDGPDWLV